MNKEIDVVNDMITYYRAMQILFPENQKLDYFITELQDYIEMLKEKT